MQFDKVDVTTIGAGGDTPTLVDDINELVVRAAREVLERDSAGAASLTIKITVAKSGEDSVHVGHTTKYTAPPQKRRALLALMDGTGELVTQHARPGKLIKLMNRDADFEAQARADLQRTVARSLDKHTVYLGHPDAQRFIVPSAV